MSQQNTAAAQSSGPWWKFGYVWMIIAGPVSVVVAGIVTLWFIMGTPDPVIEEDYYRKGLEINKTLDAADADMTPAMKGRNHAATPLQDRPQ